MKFFPSIPSRKRNIELIRGMVGVLSLALVSCTTVDNIAKSRPKITTTDMNQQRMHQDVERRADLDARVDAMEREIQTLKGKLEVLEQPKKYREKTSPGGEGQLEETTSTTKQEAGAFVEANQRVKEIKTLIDREDYEEALQKLEKWVATEKNPYFLFYLAEAHFRLEQYSKALIEFEQLKNDFPNFNMLPQAYLRQGEAFTKLGKWPDAELFYEQLIKDFPASKEAEIAKTRLAQFSH